MPSRKFGILLILLALSACGESEEERQRREDRAAAACRATDWWALGMEDGVKGLPSDQFGQYRRECAPYGVTADIMAYLDGRDEGLREYCKPWNGYRAGSEGHRYNNVCPPELEAAFSQAHADGMGLYDRQMAVQNARNRLNQAKRRADDLELIIADKTTEMISPSTTMEGRINLGIELKQLTQEKVEVEKSIPQLETDLNATQSELDAYRNSLAGRYPG